MARIRIGIQLYPQHTTYADFANAVQRAEDAGVDTLWNWDHFFPTTGSPRGGHFESWTLLTAMAMLTRRVEVGCLVTCNSYRNPNLLADMARTVDHISGGRLILGIGAGWFQRDYTEYRYEYGTGPSRAKSLADNLPIIKDRLQKLAPAPLRNPIPLLIGGGGEKVTLRLVAQYADIWNDSTPPEPFKHKNAVLDRWCREIGRDPARIERSVLTSPYGLDSLDAYAAAGATHIILGWGAPWDMTPVKSLIAWRAAQG